MRKTILLTTVIAFTFAIAPAFGIIDQAKDARPYNGITCFDLGNPSAQQEAAVTAQKEPAVNPFNGITHFDLGQPRAAAKKNYAARGSAAGGTAPEEKPYNGITVF